jgi:uncharacterized protein
MNPMDKIAAAADELEKTANDNGGAYEEPAAYKGSVARTMFDKPGAEDGTVVALIPEVNIGRVSRESYVRIPSIDPRSGQKEAEYIGVISSGPFAEPDALSATAPTLVVAAAHGAVLTPGYHGIAEIEVFGEQVEGQTIPPLRRPCPNSPVFLLEDDKVKAILGLDVDARDRPVRIGLLDGVSNLPIEVPAAKKSVLFKHLGILGTTGGGKSTTVSGLISCFAGAGNAIIVFDIEGEYTTVEKPTTHPRMLAALKKRGLEATGVEKTRIFHLAGRKTANPGHPDIRPFKVAFDGLSMEMLLELLDLNDAQAERLAEAHDICKFVMSSFNIYPTTTEERVESLEVDELVSGWPRMTLEMLQDVVSLCMEKAGGEHYQTVAPQFRGNEDQIREIIKKRNPKGDKRPWATCFGRLNRMRKAGIFTDRQNEQITADRLVSAGGVSIVDLSDMDAPYLRNMVIAQVLRILQLHQDAAYKAFEADGEAVADGMVKVNIFIEEAHEFLSAQRIKQMPNLFDQVARIARRGRKRYLGLVFITQLPSHLPDEVLGLINNWVLHKITDTGVSQRLRKIVPGVTDATWRSLPNLSPGQAVCSFTHLIRPVTATIDPSPCQLRMVD